MSVPYCEVADVKEILRLPTDYSDSDVELARSISSADRLLRSWAKAQGLTIPDAVPEEIFEASRHLAGWAFKIHGDPPCDDLTLYGLGKQFFDSWAEGARVVGDAGDPAFLIGSA